MSSLAQGLIGAGEGEWSSDKKRLYEFIVRSFLATCSKPAVGFETTVRATVAEEGFHVSGAYHLAPLSIVRTKKTVWEPLWPRRGSTSLVRAPWQPSQHQSEVHNYNVGRPPKTTCTPSPRNPCCPVRGQHRSGGRGVRLSSGDLCGSCPTCSLTDIEPASRSLDS